MKKNTVEQMFPILRTLVSADSVDLLSVSKGLIPSDKKIIENLWVGKKQYSAVFQRKNIRFTNTERGICTQCFEAFKYLSSRINSEGMEAHFRTAFVASLSDISIARYLRAEDKMKYWAIQLLIQTLKQLSFQKYEGTQATTGFLVTQLEIPNLIRRIKKHKFHINQFKKPIKVDNEFFANPLSYRFVNGTDNIYICDFAVKTHGTISFGFLRSSDEIDGSSHKIIADIINDVVEQTFAIFINDKSEIEILLPGNILLIWRKGYWSVFDPANFESFLGSKLKKAILQDLIWTVYALSKARHGALILIGDLGKDEFAKLKKGSVGGENTVVKELGSFVTKQLFTHLKSQGAILGILSSDGMTIIDSKGEVLDTCIIINTAAEYEKSDQISTKLAHGGGGRTTAARVASYFGKVIKVSEDGPIEFYYNGDMQYRFGL